VGLPVIGWIALGGPIRFEPPVLQRFNFVGGFVLSPEFSALLFGLVIYTAAFIGEVVRGGIQSVRRGQLEAAYAVGLTHGQTLRLVVFPQALRVIVPPLTSQYLNLAKNSSLAIAIGFPDLFSVSRTMSNQTGQPVSVIVMVMATYLAISLATSLLMNVYNRRVQVLER
jgi:general L-amino acid transport system permease protein